jgi:hypothetical protein
MMLKTTNDTGQNDDDDNIEHNNDDDNDDDDNIEHNNDDDNDDDDDDYLRVSKSTSRSFPCDFRHSPTHQVKI